MIIKPCEKNENTAFKVLLEHKFMIVKSLNEHVVFADWN
jgi:hypothetical protein